MLTWFDASTSWVRDLFSLTANSLRIFSDILLIIRSFRLTNIHADTPHCDKLIIFIIDRVHCNLNAWNEESEELNYSLGMEREVMTGDPGGTVCKCHEDKELVGQVFIGRNHGVVYKKHSLIHKFLSCCVHLVYCILFKKHISLEASRILILENCCHVEDLGLSLVREGYSTGLIEKSQFNRRRQLLSTQLLELSLSLLCVSFMHWTFRARGIHIDALEITSQSPINGLNLCL